MDSNELIQIARECEIPNSVIYADEIEKFAKRIRAGDKQRIAELEKDCDILAQNHEADRREIERLKSALSGMLGIVADSQGVAGYHLNGEISEWGEFEEIDAAYEALKGAE